MPLPSPDLSRLRYFTFVHAIGGHANDGDRLCCAWSADTPIEALPPALRPSALTVYGYGTLCGVSVFRWRQGDRELLDVMEPAAPYDVTAASVEGAIRIEAFLSGEMERWPGFMLWSR